MIIPKEIRHFHMFCGLGGGAKGFNKANVRVGNMVGKFRCIGGIDVCAPALHDFKKLVGMPGTVIDLFDRDQYIAFHGKEPPAGWREATPQDIQRAAGNERPHIVFLSAPCKGFSGLMSESKSKTDKYQALNRLTLRGVWLMLEAWADDPVEMIVFENVPRIANRGRFLLDQIMQLLRHYGYAVAETTHDCGELGALAQSRKRFLLVARHEAKVPPFLYEPERKNLRGVGEILGRMPMPGTGNAGAMHRIPALQWKTWVRLAFVKAGGDWRSLRDLEVVDGNLKDFLIVPAHDKYHGGYLGVNEWLPWSESMGAVSGQSTPGGGVYSVADPRMPDAANRHHGFYRVIKWDSQAHTITGASHVAGAAMSVADPRQKGEAFSKYGVTAWDAPAGTVISGSTTGQGAFSVADPRSGLDRGQGDNYLTGGHYGVIGWDQSSGAVSASANLDNGRWSVADPRIPAANENLIAIITAMDGTWHRPFTTLELAAIQSLIEPEEYLELYGLSDQSWRERIGNAVPPDAAQAIAEVMGTTLLLAWAGETFTLSSQPIWVRPVAIALSVANPIQMVN
jgi:site-specific DNA-cytosine methylase